MATTIWIQNSRKAKVGQIPHIMGKLLAKQMSANVVVNEDQQYNTPALHTRNRAKNMIMDSIVMEMPNS